MRLSLILFTLLFLFSHSSFCQKIDDSENTKSQQEQYDLYTLKKKNNQTAAWLLLGTGTALLVGGLLTADSAEDADNIGESIGNSIEGTVLAIAGGGIVAASIPFFITANNNKNRAELALKGGTITYHNISVPRSKYIGLSVKIPIGN